MNTMDIERALAQGQQIPPNAPQITPEIVQQGIAASQQQQPQIPTGEQAMNAAALEGMAKENAQYQAAVNEALAQQQTQQNIAALANLFTDYSRPSDDIYNETYDNLVMNGIYGENAHRLASRKASEYSANRLARLQMGMQTDGVTPEGYITNNGMYYLTQMQNEDPAVASLYAQGIGNMPKVAYDRQWDIAKSDHNAARQFGYSQRAADAQMGRQMSLAEFNSRLSTQQKLALMQAEPQVRMQIAKNFGLSDTDAVAFALGLNGGGRGSNRNRSGNGTVGSMDAWKALERALKEYNGAQAELAPGMVNPNTALYQSALYNYFGGIDPSNPQNYAMWKDFYMKTRGMSSDDFDQMVNDMMERSKHQEETIDKNSRLEVNGNHYDDEGDTSTPSEDDRELAKEILTGEKQTSEQTEPPTESKEEARNGYNADISNSPVANVYGLNDVADYDEQLPDYGQAVVDNIARQQQEQKRRIWEAYFGK